MFLVDLILERFRHLLILSILLHDFLGSDRQMVLNFKRSPCRNTITRRIHLLHVKCAASFSHALLVFLVGEHARDGHGVEGL